MKTLFSFLLLAVLASGCSEKEIAPEGANVKTALEDDQPPKEYCNGLPGCK